MYSENSNGQREDDDLKFIPLNISEPFKNKDSSWYPVIDTSSPTLSNISNNFIMGLSVPVDNSNLEARSFRTLDYLPRNEMNLGNPMNQVLDNKFNNNQMLEQQMNNNSKKYKKSNKNLKNSMNNMNPNTMNPNNMNLNGMNPSSMNPSSMNPSSMNPNNMNLNNMNPGSMNPNNMNLNVMNPSSMNPNNINLNNMNPGSMNPNNMNPNNMNLNNMNPSSMSPNSMNPSNMNLNNMNKINPYNNMNPNNINTTSNNNPMSLQENQLSGDVQFDLEYPSETLGDELHSYNSTDDCKSKVTKRENNLINSNQNIVIERNDFVDDYNSTNFDYEGLEESLIHMELLRELTEETSHSYFFRGESYNLLEEVDDLFDIIKNDEDIINICKSYRVPEPIYNLVINKIIKRTLENTTYKRGE